MKNTCYIALGSNVKSTVGTPLETLKYTLGLISLEALNIRKISNWYLTPAFPVGTGPDFVNGVVHAETDDSPENVLNKLHTIERLVGRTRDNRWEPRICDLDLLAYNENIQPDLSTYRKWRDLPPTDQKTMTPAELILPHPRLQDRAFVLVPMRDVAPNWEHPVSGMTVAEMIAGLPPKDIEQIQVISP